MSVITPPQVATDWKSILSQRAHLGLPGHMGIEVVEVRTGFVCLQLVVQPHHVAPNGYLHAGTVVTLADTACGFGCLSNLPEGARNFTTVELKANFLRTVTSGVVRAEARLVHEGKRTHVWDATVLDAQSRSLALFRCTQMFIT